MRAMTAHANITQLIQLAIAPVFLLTAVGTLIGVLTTFLTRTVERIRILEERQVNASAGVRSVATREIEVLKHRLRLIFLALMMNVVCAVLVGLLIVAAFVAAFLNIDLAIVIALLFAAAMLAFIGGLLILLRGIFLAITRVTGFVASERDG